MVTRHHKGSIRPRKGRGKWANGRVKGKILTLLKRSYLHLQCITQMLYLFSLVFSIQVSCSDFLANKQQCFQLSDYLIALICYHSEC